MFGRAGEQQEKFHILDEHEIADGIDELGVLLYGHKKNAYWYGSQLSIDETRDLAPYQNATGLQVTSAVLAGMVWALENPQGRHRRGRRDGLPPLPRRADALSRPGDRRSTPTGRRSPAGPACSRKTSTSAIPGSSRTCWCAKTQRTSADKQRAACAAARLSCVALITSPARWASWRPGLGRRLLAAARSCRLAVRRRFGRLWRRRTADGLWRRSAAARRASPQAAAQRRRRTRATLRRRMPRRWWRRLALRRHPRCWRRDLRRRAASAAVRRCSRFIDGGCRGGCGRTALLLRLLLLRPDFGGGVAASVAAAAALRLARRAADGCRAGRVRLLPSGCGCRCVGGGLIVVVVRCTATALARLVLGLRPRCPAARNCCGADPHRAGNALRAGQAPAGSPGRSAARRRCRARDEGRRQPGIDRGAAAIEAQRAVDHMAAAERRGAAVARQEI